MRAFPRWETSALPRAWVSGWRGDAAGEERERALREGAEEICEVLAVCVRPGQAV